MMWWNDAEGNYDLAESYGPRMNMEELWAGFMETIPVEQQDKVIDDFQRDPEGFMDTWEMNH